ncbi:DUF6119 family protein [Glycomyces halotolerans]
MQGSRDLRSFVRPKYHDSETFDIHDCLVGDREGVLVSGEMRSEKAKWAERVSTISGVAINIENVTPAAVLLIRDGQNEAWALSFGMGFQLLDQAFIDSGFGIRIATRTATPEAIRSLTKNELDYRGRTDRSSIPAGESLKAFGVEHFGEIVTRIAGAAVIEDLANGSGSVTIRAADALSIPLGKGTQDLLNDLDLISNALESEPKPELETLEQFSRVKHSELLDLLNEHLTSAIVEGVAASRLALGWPHERIDENGTPEAFRIVGPGIKDSEIIVDLPSLEDLLEAVLQRNSQDPLAAARVIKVVLFRDADGTEPISQAIPILNWLTFEAEIHNTRYCFFSSKWYAMNSDYGERLQRAVEKIFRRTPIVELPSWDRSVYPTEKKYNDAVAKEMGGWSLDQKLIRTSYNKHGFEACDILTPNGDYLHVKHVPGSGAASHLVAQALVSIDALMYDEDALSKLREVAACSGAPTELMTSRPHSVVLVMARDRKITATDLFTFTKVTLVRLDKVLAAREIELTVVSIGYREKGV